MTASLNSRVTSAAVVGPGSDKQATPHNTAGITTSRHHRVLGALPSSRNSVPRECMRDTEKVSLIVT
eukprot:CAMPEP_0169065688 /NCGR_PEP_ID=MMETSP1015-20121227/2539_1 /TAXON_ID=342587 /ORGANISM="Karlodinium micrum, Strain CCMP2283" /LENGTH=66 /DNA_ID=CAMNT_0009124283 /DNA_START=863 /DNA_END=1059 /DNA_ORIENTATION=-